MPDISLGIVEIGSEQDKVLVLLVKTEHIKSCNNKCHKNLIYPYHLVSGYPWCSHCFFFFLSEPAPLVISFSPKGLHTIYMQKILKCVSSALLFSSCLLDT